VPIARISIAAGRSPAQIHALAKNVTEAIADSLGADTATIRVLVDELELDHWFAGGVSLESRQTQR
jgi:4-oxalocrotonate tautomerase